MKKILISGLALTFFIFVFTMQLSYAIPNPWTECGRDKSCGVEKAGFDFPIDVKNYNIRAMEGMMEITFSLNKKKTVIARKALKYDVMADNHGIKDISGDYNKYPVNKTITLKHGVVFNVRGYKKKYHVANFAAESGYYSFYSAEGMKHKDIEYLYKLLEKSETEGKFLDK